MLAVVFEVAAVTMPVVIFAAWQSYLRHHFGVAPSDQAGGILGPFLKGFMQSFRSVLSGYHPLADGRQYIVAGELRMLIVFGALLFLYLAVFCLVILQLRNFSDPGIVIVAFAPTVMIYFFLGSTVMMHYSGYLKAANIILFLVPWGVASLNSLSCKFRYILLGLILICTMAELSQFAQDRLRIQSTALPLPSTIDEQSGYFDLKSLPIAEHQSALNSLASKVVIAGNYSFFSRELFRELRRLPEIRVFEVDVTNLGEEPYLRVSGWGAVRLSYHWLSADATKILGDGRRAYIQMPLLPGQTQRVKLYVEYPRQPGDYVLRISLVQEGNTWFYFQGLGFSDFLVKVL
jgi:hypothetical protein